MKDMTAGEATSGRPSNLKRILFLVVIGLGSINAVQFAKGLLAERVAAQEVREALAPQATTDRFHNLFYKDPNTLERNRWMGIPAVQNPNDIWITQEILFEVKPDFVIEAGTYMGGSAVMWAMMLREINPAGRVITIDIQDLVGEAKKLPIFKERVDFLLGSSTAPEIVAEVRRRVDGHSVVVILDSDHRKDHVRRELQAYADLVRVGGYIIVQDSNINGHPVVIESTDSAGMYANQPGPMEALTEFLAVDSHFKIDLDRERLMLTMNPHGYLRRVR
jgi:cephalosporin hydroxylase